MSISLSHITLAYGSRILLHNASAELPPATLTALIGRNGTGKSTLLRAIVGLGSPASGDIRLCGTPLTELSSQRLATSVSWVSTEKTRIAGLTCQELVALGRAPYTDWTGRLRATDRTAVHRALETVKMADFAAKTMETLSDGECQRIMIARALAQDTPVILLDEPTAFLDLPNRYATAALLAHLAHNDGKCILFSTHDLDIALALCDSVLLLDPPHLHHLPAADLTSNDLLDRLLSDSDTIFSPAIRQFWQHKK